VIIKVEASGAWFATTGEVGDLDVSNEICESTDRGPDLVAVVSEMKEVKQHADVRIAGAAHRSHECSDL